jgi:hypothetical protein
MASLNIKPIYKNWRRCTENRILPDSRPVASVWCVFFRWLSFEQKLFQARAFDFLFMSIFGLLSCDAFHSLRMKLVEHFSFEPSNLLSAYTVSLMPCDA